MKQSEAEKFVEQLRLAGKMDSSGNFTVCPQHSFQGLKVFEVSAECLLKLVQSAVGARANSIEVRIGVRSVEVVFDPDGDYSVSALLEQLADPSKEWSSLVLALQGALRVGFKEIRLTSWCGGEGQSLRLTDGGIEESEPFSWPWEDESGLRVKLIRESGLFSLKSLSARFAESRVLSSRCRFCPVPLKSSGFLVNDPDIYSGLKHRGSSVVEAVVRPRVGRGFLCGPTPDYRWTHSLSFEDEEQVGETEFNTEGEAGLPHLFVTLDGAREQKVLDIVCVRPADPSLRREALQGCEAVLGFCRYGIDETRVFPVIDGVCCQPLKIGGLAPATVVFIAAGELRTDFAGFRVVQDELLDALVSEIGDYLDRMFKALDKTRFASLGPDLEVLDSDYDKYERPEDWD